MNRLISRARQGGMSLVEVAIALGIISFCAVSLMGLLPVMLNSMHDSRESALTYRIYQAVAADLRENRLAKGEARDYYFNQEGLQSPSGVTTGDFLATAAAPVTASLPDGGIGDTGAAAPSVDIVLVTIKNTVRKVALLKRPVYVAQCL